MQLSTLLREKAAAQIASRHTEEAKRTSARAVERQKARIARIQRKLKREQAADVLAMRIATASSDKVLKTGRERARKLVKKYVANIATPGLSGPHLLELSREDAAEFLLPGTRMYSLLLIVSGRDYYGDCAPCKHTHQIVVATAEKLWAAQEARLRALAAAPAESSPLERPVNVLESDAHALPVIPVAIDASTYMDFLRLNKVQGVPMVAVVLPTMDPRPTPQEKVVETFHGTHHWHYPNSGATHDSITTFMTGLFDVRAEHTSGPRAVNTALTAVQSAQNPLATFFQSLPLWTLVGASWIVVLAGALLLRHGDVLLAGLRRLKPVIAAVALLGWAFNVAGGLFMRTAGANFVPSHLQRASLWSIWLDPPRWVANGFRDQYGVEGAILMAVFVSFAAATTLLVLVGLRPVPAATSNSSGSGNGESKEGKGKGGVLSAVVSVVRFVVGVVLPALLLTLAVMAFLHGVRLFLHKIGGYVNDVMWSYEGVSRVINTALATLRIPLRLPRYLVRNLG